mgnify:CR=1 FL=1
MSLVNSHNEWDQLEEVIVGDGFPETVPALDFSFKVFFHDNIFGKNFDPKQYIKKRHVIEHKEDIERFVELLKSLDIIVKRPKVPKKVFKTKTPNWESTDYPALNVRDMAMVVGDKIIESPPTCRYRYFENNYLSHLFLEYFKNGRKWIQAPKPIMTDNSFDLSWIDESNGRQHYNDIKNDNNYMDCGYEIMFDAANCMRLGGHILMNVANENQRLGAKWLQGILGEKYTLLTTSIADSHIDSSFLPLRPGLGIITKEYIKDKLPNELSDWDLIYIPMRNRNIDEYEEQGVNLASPRIELNVFSINPELIICHPQYEKILNEKLKKYKIEAIGSPFRHCELFSGAHHCTTLDIRRKSKYEKYF